MSKRPTIHDVARVAGVSKSTVSRVLQGADASVADATRRQVLEAIEALSYTHNAVASSLRTKRTSTVMLLIPNIDNPFWPAVARGLQDTLAAAGYAVVFANSDWELEQERSFLEMARRNRFAALAVNPAAVPHGELAALGVPVVILGLRHLYTGLDTVGSDSYEGTQQALRYLYGLGHRRIGMIWGQRGSQTARYRAYQDFMAAHGLCVEHDLVAPAPYTLEGGRRAARRLLTPRTRPTALFAANDMLALATIQVACELHLDVPGDLSVVGMDDIEPASFATPTLTTVAKDKYELGRRAADLLLSRLDGTAPAGPQRVVIPCKLVERQSAGPPATTGENTGE